MSHETSEQVGRPGGRFALELDGANAGAYARGGGGNALGVVLEDDLGPDHLAHKHIAGVKYEDITVACGAGTSKDFYNWIKASFDGKEARHRGRLTSREADGTVVDAVSFENALISEVSFPALECSGQRRQAGRRSEVSRRRSPPCTVHVGVAQLGSSRSTRSHPPPASVRPGSAATCGARTQPSRSHERRRLEAQDQETWVILCKVRPQIQAVVATPLSCEVGGCRIREIWLVGVGCSTRCVVERRRRRPRR
jgi:hypothetical protein